MDESIIDQPSGLPGGTLSRRELLKGAGVSAMGAVPADSVEHDALQCGFCTPGMVMTCAALVEHNPKPTLDDVKSAVSGNLCRCGTYPNVFAATLAAAQDAPRVSAREWAGTR